MVASEIEEKSMGDAVGGDVGLRQDVLPAQSSKTLEGRSTSKTTPFNNQQQISRLRGNVGLSSISTMVLWVVLPLHEEMFKNMSSFSWAETHCLILQTGQGDITLLLVSLADPWRAQASPSWHLHPHPHPPAPPWFIVPLPSPLSRPQASRDFDLWRQLLCCN